MVAYLENCLTNIAVKEFWKSVYICQSYDKKSSVLFFLRHSVDKGCYLMNSHNLLATVSTVSTYESIQRQYQNHTFVHTLVPMS